MMYRRQVSDSVAIESAHLLLIIVFGVPVIYVPTSSLLKDFGGRPLLPSLLPSPIASFLPVHDSAKPHHPGLCLICPRKYPLEICRDTAEWVAGRLPAVCCWREGNRRTARSRGWDRRLGAVLLQGSTGRKLVVPSQLILGTNWCRVFDLTDETKLLSCTWRGTHSQAWGTGHRWTTR